MNQLTKYLLDELLIEDNSINRIVVIYVGRFQPFHPGHYSSYLHLVNKFGKDNVYIGTSDVTDATKSPLSFEDKRMVMTRMFGIPSKMIHKVKVPYRPTEILSKFSDKTTAYITAVGEKDVGRLSGKYFTTYSDKIEILPYGERGYIYYTPVASGSWSGTNVRTGFRIGSVEDKKRFFTKVYGKFDKKVFELILKKIGRVDEILNTAGIISKDNIQDWVVDNIEIIKEISRTLGKSDVDDGANIFTSYDVFRNNGDIRAAKIGYELIQQVLSDKYYNINTNKYRVYPNGPVKAVTPYPAGVAGKTTATNQKDYYGDVAYSKWFNHVTKSAALVGYSIIDSIHTKEDKRFSLDHILSEPGAVTEHIIKEIPMDDLHQIDRFADKQMAPVDVVITHKHFLDRLIDPRNTKPISAAELIGFFKRLSKKKSEFVEFLKKYGEIVAKDNRTKINIPFMKQANKAIAKTILRKDNFKTPSPELKLESLNEGMYDTKNIKAYYEALCKAEGIKPLPVKFERVGKGGAATTYNSKTMKPVYISFDVSRLSDPEFAIIHELTHQIKLETEGDAYLGKRDQLAKFKKLENHLIDKYVYSKYSKLLYENKNKEEWAIFKINGGRKWFAARWNDGTKLPDVYDKSLKYSSDEVLKFTHREAIKIIQRSIGLQEKYGIVNSKGLQKLFDWRIKYPTRYDDVKSLINEDTVKYISKSLGIVRKDMPQIKSKHTSDFIRYLQSNGIKASAKVVSVDKLGMTQRDINVKKVKELMGIAAHHLNKPVIVSNDYYILDGHHRILALYNMDPNFKIKCIFVNVPMQKLLQLASNYPLVSYKSIDELMIGYAGDDDLKKHKSRMHRLRKKLNKLDENDAGKSPYVIYVNDVARKNTNFRDTIWTGEHLQLTTMSINVGDDIGLEVHKDGDQFICVTSGVAKVCMGVDENQLNFERVIDKNACVLVPAGYWHNIKNASNIPLKLYVIYAPVEHTAGRVDIYKSTELNERTVKAGIYRGPIKIGNISDEIEVELYGVDNRTREYLTRIISVPSSLNNKLKVGQEFRIPSRAFHAPRLGSGWRKVDTRGMVEIMTEAKSLLKLNIPKSILDIHKAFKANGKKLYIVGGAVRDVILGKQPKDFDLATDAKPEEVIDIAKKYGMHYTEVGKSFGVVVINDMEVATFRADIGKGRRPDRVEYTDIYGDVKRRDLTINALFYDIDRKEIVDLVGGIADLRNNKIRTVGNAVERFDEDPLRKLRTIRFASRLGGTLDKSTFEAILTNPSLNGVSEERIRDEFIKSVNSAKSVKSYLKLMEQTKLLYYVFPNLKWNSSDFIDESNVVLLISYIFRRYNPQDLYKALMKLKYTHDEANSVKFLVELYNFNSANIYKYKRAQSNVPISNNDIIKWGRLVGIDLTKFVKFKLSVSGEDVMKLGHRGKSIGDEIERQETQNYLTFAK